MKQWRYFLCMLCLVACNFAYAATKSIIIDTDASTDDAIAVLYLLQNKNVNVAAIIVDRNGGSNPKTAANHIGYLLHLANKENIPVYIGIKKNAVYKNNYPEWLYVLVDKSYGNNTTTPKNLISQHDLANLIMSKQQSLSLLSLGSLTNIADLLQKYPKTKSKITDLTIMGGAIETNGNIQTLLPKSNNAEAEWNVFVDPAAFQQVLQSQLPITLVSLDITDKILVTISFLDQLKQNQYTPASQFVYQLLQKNIYWIKENQYDFWDPLAAYVLIHPEQIKVEQKHVQTVLTHDKHFGQLVETPTGSSVNMVIYVNKMLFEKSLLDNLNLINNP